MARHSRLQSQKHGRATAIRIVIGLLIVVCGYLVFEFGRIQANYNIADAANERQAFEDQIDGLNAKILALKEQVTLLETHRDIDREAYKDVEASLGTLQAKIQEQSDAIAFYRGIVSPTDGAAGLRVQDLKLSRGNDERTYHLRLVLVQSLKHDRKVSGDVVLTVEGTQQGAAASYAYSELSPESEEGGWAFSFRYFQDFDRELVLPDGFSPERITIEVNSKTRAIDSVEQSFSWTASLG